MTTYLQEGLAEIDPTLYELCQSEKKRQLRSLELIASENFVSKAVLECLRSSFHNKYSEGQVGARYYGGNEYVDLMEALCQDRALKLFQCNLDEWGVNVQPYSGSPANFAVYTALVGPHGRIMGLNLPDGGHLTHGYQTPTKMVSASSLFFESVCYKVDQKTDLIDYDELERTAKLFRPKLIIAGISAYPRGLDYARFRKICDDIGAILMADMAHISGLVAAGVVASPFQHCDVVTSTTHKTLRGPRAGMIFYRKGLRRVTEKGEKVMYDYERKINDAVFPGLQGGPHNNTIAGMAAAFHMAMKPEFRTYQQRVLSNCRALCEALTARGYNLVTGGSDNHMCLMDFRGSGIDGRRAEYVLEKVDISANKNACPGDASPLRPSGIRLGTPALTSRNFTETDMDSVAEFIHEAVGIALRANAEVSGTLLKDFKTHLNDNGGLATALTALRLRVNSFAEAFPMPGFEDY